VGHADHHELGRTLVGTSNTSRAIHCETGIDSVALVDHLAKGGKLVEYPEADPIPAEELVSLNRELLIPAALGGTIHAANADSIRARLVIEGANNPTTLAADDILREKGNHGGSHVLANAGGVVVSYFEWCRTSSTPPGRSTRSTTSSA
jgi:glutamate dehydrogenase (NAD(P)+)